MSRMIACTKCHELLDETLFHQCRVRTHLEKGTAIQCKKCANACNRKWYEANREKRGEKIAAYRSANAQKCLDWYQRYSEINRERLALRKRQYHRTPSGYAMYLYKSIEMRLKHSPSYKGRRLHFSRDEFLLWLESSNYLALFEDWKKSGHSRKLSPSVDRIDEMGDYHMNNIQLLTLFDNTKKYANSPIGIARATERIMKYNESKLREKK